MGGGGEAKVVSSLLLQAVKAIHRDRPSPDKEDSGERESAGRHKIKFAKIIA